jgi:hypothetical protein
VAQRCRWRGAAARRVCFPGRRSRLGERTPLVCPLAWAFAATSAASIDNAEVARREGVSEQDCERIVTSFAYEGFRLPLEAAA